MALINCNECGKEVSEKAVSCPTCGNPINSIKEIEEEYLCCPKCNSKELHSEQKGFSGGKALAGALLTGGIGILAGTIGSRDVNVTCLKCGNKFKAGEAKIIKANEYEVYDYNDLEIITLLKNGNTFKATTLIQIKNNIKTSDTNAAEKTTNIINEYSKRHNIELKPYQIPKGCAGLIVLFISIGSLVCLLIQ
jgi:DNA-directed RNA polymerase subunit RPC12/RpoP